MRSVELFAGAGGLAIGIARAGFQHLGIIEHNQWCCETINDNRERRVSPLGDWPAVTPTDVKEIQFDQFPHDIALVSGGPPCQPFSLGGKHGGQSDSRNLFPDLVRAVRVMRPRAVIVENVRGLLRKSFDPYFKYLLLNLMYPTLVRCAGEEWQAHLARLERHHAASKEPEYRVDFEVLNAADYGVPQIRKRVFIVAFRADVGIEWSFRDDLPTTHSPDRLLWDQWVTGEYWDRHHIPLAKRPAAPSRRSTLLKALSSSRCPPAGEPWMTVRDAVSDLPDPRSDEARNVANHRFNPGARSYPGHTGSPWDQPAKTLKAGDHGVPGGENTLRHPNGRVRYFTVREAARLQTFSDSFEFHGSWTETMRQLGNAVPVQLAYRVAKSVANALCSVSSLPANSLPEASEPRETSSQLQP
ncbi:MAG: DNA cytosine methyltransferase [Gammaproteobacteria bacterium]|nr:DNA cytosine methyltransferase [Gammaproteobacteria bacterium]